MERCTQHTLTVYGGSDRPYIVSVKDDEPSCTCMMFAYNKSLARASRPGEKPAVHWCQHLHAQWTKLCRWEGEPLIEGMCDRCGGPTEWIPDPLEKD